MNAKRYVFNLLSLTYRKLRVFDRENALKIYVQQSYGNLIFFYRFVGAVMPPDNLEELFEQGYVQTDEFLQSEKFKKFLTDLNVPPSATDINGAIREKRHA